MHRLMRMALGLLSATIAISLSGCGFVNVANLKPSVRKTYALIVASRTWLRNAQVANELASPPDGVSIVSMITDGVSTTRLISEIDHSNANVIVMIQPVAALLSLPADHPQVHYDVIGAEQPVAGQNVTTVAPNPEQAASVAGYIAGGNAVLGQPIYVLSANANPIAMAGVVNAVYSGARAAFSKSSVSWTNALATSYSALNGIWLVWGNVPTSDVAPIIATRQPLITINSNNDLSSTTLLAELTSTAWVANGLKMALQTIAEGQSPPTVNVPVKFRLLASSGWQQPDGITNYENMIAQGTLSPTGFLQGVPSVKAAQSLRLPLPPHTAKG